MRAEEPALGQAGPTHPAGGDGRLADATALRIGLPRADKRPAPPAPQ